MQVVDGDRLVADQGAQDSIPAFVQPRDQLVQPAPVDNDGVSYGHVTEARASRARAKAMAEPIDAEPWKSRGGAGGNGTPESRDLRPLKRWGLGVTMERGGGDDDHGQRAL